MSVRLRVAVADGFAPFRVSLVETLTAADVEVVGEATSADEVLALAWRVRPDVVLLDAALPGGALSAARTIRAVCPPIKVVLLADTAVVETARAVLAAGLQGYFVKGQVGRELAGLLRRVQQGGQLGEKTSVGGLAD